MTRWILHVLGSPFAEVIAGDLHEEFVLVSAAEGSARARSWHARQVVCSAAPLLMRGAAELGVTLAPAAILLAFSWKSVFALLCIDALPGFFEGMLASLALGAMLAGRLRDLAAALLVLILCSAALTGAASFPHVIAAVLAVPAGAFSARIFREVI